MPQVFANNAYSTLAVGLSAGDTTLSVATGHGARWPTIAAPDFCYTTLENASGTIEIVEVTAHSAGADLMTIVRGQQGTSAASWAIGDLVEMRSTKVEMGAWEQDIDDLQASRALKAGDVYAGTHNFTGATMTVAAPSAAAHPARKQDVDDAKTYADQLAFGALGLPGQTGNGGKALATNGATPSWVTVAKPDVAQTFTQPQTFGANAIFGAGIRETKIAMPVNDIDLNAATFFTKSISGNTTLTVSNVPAAGIAASFILELTNGGSATITFGTGFTSVKWANGSVPSLTAAGVDLLGFYTHDGGATWRAVILAKDSK